MHVQSAIYPREILTEYRSWCHLWFTWLSAGI